MNALKNAPTTTPNVPSNTRTPQRWRAEFPYFWDSDELVGRRELLRFAVMTSGTLFIGTAVLAVLGWLDNRRRGTAQQIATMDQIKDNEPYYFNYPGPEDQAVLLRRPNGSLVAYSQKCTHLSCAVYYVGNGDILYCPCHEGIFDPETGQPIAGPPRRQLPRIALKQDGNKLIAMEEVP